MNVLVINAGSSSLKYQLLDMSHEALLASGGCERIGLPGSKIKHKANGEEFVEEIAMPNHAKAFREVKRLLTQGAGAVIASLDEISAVGHRVVHGGEQLKNSVIITDDILSEIERVSELAPLHNPAGLQGIRACGEVFGPEVPNVAVFDTAFHSTMPPEAYMFALPYEYYEQYGIRRYGFHGTSHKFVSTRCAQLMGKPFDQLKIITCHLGNGSSIAAIQNGKVIDTSMGLTPLDGFMMGTRSGGVDPSAVLYLMKKEGWTPDETSDVLNKKSGALGISGVSSDERDIKAAAAKGNVRAQLSQTILRYQIRKFIGAYVAAMNGVDAIVFTGGIGENNTTTRKIICEGLSYLGVEVDVAVNKVTRQGKQARISTDASRVQAWVIPTNEELLIARETAQLAG